MDDVLDDRKLFTFRLFCGNAWRDSSRKNLTENFGPLQNLESTARQIRRTLLSNRKFDSQNLLVVIRAHFAWTCLTQSIRLFFLGGPRVKQGDLRHNFRLLEIDRIESFGDARLARALIGDEQYKP